MLVSRGAAEGARLASRQEGDPRTFSGLAGTGELVASLAVPDHPGGRRGLALARGEPDDDLAELCAALLAVEPNLPITAGVGAVAAGHLSAQDALATLMTRDHAGEWD
jgi:glycerol-3-phosphate dehydrogenase (NAD(P)+)